MVKCATISWKPTYVIWREHLTCSSSSSNINKLFFYKRILKSKGLTIWRVVDEFMSQQFDSYKNTGGIGQFSTDTDITNKGRYHWYQCIGTSLIHIEDVLRYAWLISCFSIILRGFLYTLKKIQIKCWFDSLKRCDILMKLTCKSI